ncbi:MAG: hypothetical protein ACR2F2_06445 [Pyrinomonadaceae bacterium]
MQNEEFSNDLFSKIDEINQPEKSSALFLIGLVGNIASWLVGILAPEKLYNFMSKFKEPADILLLYFFLFLPFLFAYLMGLSALKIYYGRKKQDLVEENNFLNSYSDHLKRENKWRIYFLSFAIACLNCIFITTFSIISYST